MLKLCVYIVGFALTQLDNASTDILLKSETTGETECEADKLEARFSWKTKQCVFQTKEIGVIKCNSPIGQYSNSLGHRPLSEKLKLTEEL